jgi:hypothetical protein
VVCGVLYAAHAAAAGSRPTARSASHTLASCLPLPLPVLGAAKHLEVAACVLIAAAVGYRWRSSAVRQIAQSLPALGTHLAVWPCALVHARGTIRAREPVADVGRHGVQKRALAAGAAVCALTLCALEAALEVGAVHTDARLVVRVPLAVVQVAVHAVVPAMHGESKARRGVGPLSYAAAVWRRRRSALASCRPAHHLLRVRAKLCPALDPMAGSG